jgi:hypothetical protein
VAQQTHFFLLKAFRFLKHNHVIIKVPLQL